MPSEGHMQTYYILFTDWFAVQKRDWGISMELVEGI